MFVKKHLEQVKSAKRKVEEAIALLKEQGDTAEVKTAIQSLQSSIVRIEAIKTVMQNEVNRLNKAFDVPLLQAVIHAGTHKEKIVIRKPNARFDFPFIPESYYDKIRSQWGLDRSDKIVTDEIYDIYVVGKYDKIIAKIKHC